jgi:putative acetyltransferase
MTIRRSLPTDREALVDIWLQAVRATHTFLSEEDIQFYLRKVRAEAFSRGEVWVLCLDSGAPTGFIGLDGGKVESLFLAPEVHRSGGGRRLIDHARSQKGELTVDVNEQNRAARDFYEACGFVVEGRSELDASGKPFPVLHMRLVEPNPDERDARRAPA